MDTNLTTKTGGKISVHFGKICTTNLWGGQWYEITDVAVIAQLKRCRTAGDFVQVRDAHNIVAIGRKYVRMQTTPQSQTSQLTTGQPYTTYQPYSTSPTEDPPENEPANDSPGAKLSEDESQPLSQEAQIFKCRLEAVEHLRNFYSEFKFSVAARMVNTMARQSCPDDVAAYAVNYALLINHPDATVIAEKTKCDEFKHLATELTQYPPEKIINKRLDIYFGDAGTGKTTKAIAEYPEAPVVPCNSAMLPDELLRTFDFNDENGNPVFKPSDLRKCMEEGKPIILDEINLLSFDCLRLLQTLTDNKNSIDFNGERIRIKDGFKVIGTMNLVVNDQVYSLPEPLVDRAGLIKQFNLSTEDLTGYAF